MPALPSRRLVGGQLDVQSKTLASSFSRPEWKRPPEYPSGLGPTFGHRARGPASWHRRSDLAIT